METVDLTSFTELKFTFKTKSVANLLTLICSKKSLFFSKEAHILVKVIYKQNKVCALTNARTLFLKMFCFDSAVVGAAQATTSAAV